MSSDALGGRRRPDRAPPANGPFQRFTACWHCLWQVTTRKKLRLFFEELKVEVTIMVFVIVYALFIFVDLAVATASTVRPSQHQCLSRWRVRSPGCTTASAFGPCPAHLVSSSARRRRPSGSCPTCALPPLHTAAVCLSPLASPLPPLHTDPRAPWLDAWLTAPSGTPLSVPEHAAGA
jgi:hypothetical protein